MDLLIIPEGIDNLPKNNQEHFVHIEKIGIKKYYDHINNGNEWNAVQDVRLRYMTSVVAAAKHFNIEPISEIEVPRRRNWNDDRFDDFVSDVSFYTMQMMLHESDRKLRTSIILEGSTRDRLKTLTVNLRDEVRKLQLPSSKIDQIIRKIDDFERSLESRKLTFITVAFVTLTIAGAITDVDGATNVVRELVNKIEETVGIAKEEQDREVASNFVESNQIPRLMAPRKNEPAIEPPSVEDDDEIPF